MPGLSATQIDAVEAEVGFKLPSLVREVYANGNGLRGPTNIWLLYPRSDGDIDDIVRTNSVLKAEDWFPPSLLNQVIIGSNGCGGLICVSGDGKDASIWYPSDGDNFVEQRSSVGEIWDIIRQQYSEQDGS